MKLKFWGVVYYICVIFIGIINFKLEIEKLNLNLLVGFSHYSTEANAITYFVVRIDLSNLFNKLF